VLNRKWILGLAAAFSLAGAVVSEAAGPCTPRRTYSAGDTVTHADYNADFVKVATTNMIATCVDDYSANAAQMQTVTDPYPGAAVSLPTTLAGELERLRYVLKALCNRTHWYTHTEACSLSGGTFTGAITSTLGTITTDVKNFSGTATWSNAGVTFTGIKLDVTDTASNAASLLMDLQKASTSQWKVTKAGATTQLGSLTGTTSLFAAGTITANAPGVSITQTWNDGAVTFQGLLVNVLATARAAASRIFSVQENSSTKFAIDTSGMVYTTGAGSGVTIGTSGSPIYKITVYQPSLTPVNVTTVTCAEQTFTVSGLLAAKDTVIVSSQSAPSNSIGLASARVSANDTLALTFCNPTGSTAAPTAGVYDVIAFQRTL